jgi:hypothetical protein
MSSRHPNSHPAILIAAAVIELKPNETNVSTIELTYGAATIPVEGCQYTGVACKERSPRYQLTAV